MSNTKAIIYGGCGNLVTGGEYTAGNSTTHAKHPSGMFYDSKLKKGVPAGLAINTTTIIDPDYNSLINIVQRQQNNPAQYVSDIIDDDTFDDFINRVIDKPKKSPNKTPKTRKSTVKNTRKHKK